MAIEFGAKFQKIINFVKKIPIAISGVGNRALPKDKRRTFWKGWIKQIKDSRKFNLISAHDVSTKKLKKLVDDKLLKQDQIYENFEKMIENEKLDAVLICNPAKFHFEYIKKALSKNLYVLVEKPVVSNFSEAKKLLKNKKNKKISVVQNWRTKDVGRILRKKILGGNIGYIGQVFFRYIRNREKSFYPNYIYKEKFPPLYAMGIHHLDLFRYILDDEIVKVSGNFFKPKWSLYSSFTGFNLHMVTRKKTFINYTSTFSSLTNINNQESLVINGSKGSLLNESNWLEPPLFLQKKNDKNKKNLTFNIKKKSIRSQYDISDKIIIENFYDFVSKRKKPICSYFDAFKTIKLVEYCKRACLSGRLVKII